MPELVHSTDSIAMRTHPSTTKFHGNSAMTALHESFNDIIDSIHTIPSLPEITAHVARLANDPATTIPMIAAVIVKDAGMSAKMLRLVNSAVFALQEPITSLDQAVSLLGFKTIRTIALSVSVVSLFTQVQAGFNMKAFWLHSAVSAGMCRTIAKMNGICDPEEAFTFGLLKDIGKLILVENMPEKTRDIIELANFRKLSFAAASRQVIKTDDAEVAAWLCQKWDLDADLVNAIRFQNDIVLASDPRMTAMNIVVEHLCALRGIRTSGNCDQPSIDPMVWPHLGLTKSEFRSVIESMNDDIAAARDLLNIVS